MIYNFKMIYNFLMYVYQNILFHLLTVEISCIIQKMFLSLLSLLILYN